MTENPLFSIVIPTYNHAHLIRRCLDSIVSQTFDCWEAIIINNYSKDNTIETVESYNDSRIRLINNANNGIIAVSRNKGITEANGEWICFLDSDDWWTPEKLEACLPYLNDYDLLYHPLQSYCEKNGIVDKNNNVYRKPNIPVFFDLLRYGNYLANSSVVIRSSLIKNIGLLCEEKDFVAIEDYEYWLKASIITDRFFCIPKVLGYYWISETSISIKNDKVNKLDVIYNKYLPFIKNKKDKNAVISKYAYDKARAYYNYGNYNEAREQFLISIRATKTYKTIKVIVFLLLIKLNIRIRK